MKENKRISIFKVLKQSIVTFLLSLIPVFAVYYISLSLSNIDLLHSGFISKGIEYFSKFLPVLISSSAGVIFVAIIAVVFSKALSKEIKIKYLLSILFFILGSFFIVTYLNLVNELPFHIVISLVITLFIMGVIISAQSIFKYVVNIIMNIFMIISFYALFSSLLSVYSHEFNEHVIIFGKDASIGYILLSLFMIFFILPIAAAIVYKSIENKNKKESDKGILESKDSHNEDSSIEDINK